MAKKLLVADDSLTIQKVIKLALSGDGYEIHTVSDGTECLQQISLFRPDVVLIDIGLPGRSAFDLKKAANEDTDISRIPFVLMSSAFEKVDEAKVALLRFDGRLTKPFDPSNLKNVLAQALKMNSGQGVREFNPPPPPGQSQSAPPSPFSLEPSERSKQIQYPRPASIAEEVTGEIQLMDPNTAIQQDPEPDPLWSESPSRSLEHTMNFEVRRGATPPPNPSSRPGSNEDDSDIRHLTESTVKMSGLDDLGGWNLSEGAKGGESSIPDIFSPTSPSIQVPAGMMGSMNSSPLEPDTHHDLQAGMGQGMNQNMSPGLDLEYGAPTPTQTQSYSQPALHSGGNVESLADKMIEKQIERQVREQLESLVQGAVKSQLEQMARKALPEITERIVKAEIRKLLEGLSSNSND